MIKVQTTKHYESDSPIGFPIQFNGNVSWLNSIELYKNETLVNTIKFKKLKNLFQFEIKDNQISTNYSIEKFTLVGRADGVQVLKTHRFVRTIPFESNFLILPTNGSYDWDFQTSEAVGIYNKNLPEFGWIKTNNTLSIGTKNGNYTPLIETTVSLFVRIPFNISVGVEIKAIIDTEPDCDFFSLGIRSINNETAPVDIIFKKSGFALEMDEVFSLKNHSGSDVELKFVFKTDPFVEGKGIELKQVSFLLGELFDQRLESLVKKRLDAIIVEEMLGDEMDEM